MKPYQWAIAGLTLLMTALQPAAAQDALEGDPAAGQAKSAICAACHGADGNSVIGEWPKIAGQHEQYLRRHITLIRDGQRPVAQMAGIVMNLTDQDIADLAAWFSSQTPAPGVADPALAEAGETLYRAGNPDTGVPACIACHGPAGKGNPLTGYPRVAGQHAKYTSDKLKAYRGGAQWGPDDANSAVMVGVAQWLSDAEIEAVASYIQGLYKAGE
jgi:cytochrome c553